MTSNYKVSKKDEKEIEGLVAEKESKEIAAETKTAQTKNLSLNSESKGFGTEAHIKDIKRRQAEGGEVSFDEEELLSHPPTA